MATTVYNNRSVAPASNVIRRFPVGAEIFPNGVHFRVWAPDRSRVEVLLHKRTLEHIPKSVELQPEGNGYFSGLVQDLGAGALYSFHLDSAGAFPDPVSRFQPEGPHGPSQVIDPSTYGWQDDGWRGKGLQGQVIYEMHIGTFTREGTYTAAIAELPELRSAGITTIEIMPVADFPGRFGWGYDGVNLFAPAHIYGTPDDLRNLVDAAHASGLAVILDVVYNHLGPDGNYLAQFTKSYLTARHKTDWGDAINFDGENSEGVREFYRMNAEYWIREFHFDGLRLDAVHAIVDDSPRHILSEIGDAVRAGAEGRETIVVAENENQNANVIREKRQGGYGLDGAWNDDFHHSAHVALTGRSEAYYSDFRGKAQEFVSAAKYGYLFQGQPYTAWKRRRGSSTLGLSSSQFVTFLENHDQVAHSGRGARLTQLASPGKLRALTAVLLLGPGTPLLFQGQEFGSSKPFLYFVDHNADLAPLVRKGRMEFLKQFPSLATDAMQRILDDPGAEATFTRCKLDFSERESNKAIYDLHKDLIALRRASPVFSPDPQQSNGTPDGAVLSDNAFLLRYFGHDGPDASLLVNLGSDLFLSPCSEPLLAPPDGAAWRVEWNSEDPRYGGSGYPEPERENGFYILGESAAWLVAQRGSSEKQG